MDKRNLKLKEGYNDLDGFIPSLKKNGLQNGNRNIIPSLNSKMAPHVITTQQQDLSCGNSVDPIEKIAKELALDIVKYASNNWKHIPYTNKYSKTLRRTVDEISRRHEILFNGMMKKLDIKKDNAEETFQNVIEELYSDNRYNWGRIVVVYAFGGRLAKYCVDNNLSSLVDTIGEIVGQYVSERLSSWIREQGGWEAFAECFPVQNNLEEKIWRGLIMTAVGLGALATMVAVR